MNRIAFAYLASLLAATPALAVTNDNGDILITQAAAQAGNVTPGDTAGFPVTISVSGTYRLASNLTVTTGVNGIEVKANEVTIEMGGHTLAGSGVGRNGITSFNRSLTVQNGTIRGFTLDGVRTIAPHLVVDHMRILANGRTGVYDDDGDSSPLNSQLTVSDSSISENTGIGIYCGASCLIRGNYITKNGSYGVEALGRAMALDNFIYLNGNWGIIGFGSFAHNTVVDNAGKNAPQMSPMDPNFCGSNLSTDCQ